jgi:hypothetical protein
MKRSHYQTSNDDFDDACDLDALLHPSQAFERPSEVVKDPDLTLNEKRAILASWASDACAIETGSHIATSAGRKTARALRRGDGCATRARRRGETSPACGGQSSRGGSAAEDFQQQQLR